MRCLNKIGEIKEKMQIVNKIFRAIRKPSILLPVLGNNGYLNWLNDSTYLKLYYRFRMNKKLNLANPKTYNEKLQWLKLHDRNPKYTQLVDKYEVRDYIEKTIGEDYLIPLLGVWDTVEEIEWESLPNQFVLKATHDSGGVVICKDKSVFDVEGAKKKLNKSMKRNYYYGTREWPYKNVKPRIIAEKYMVDESNYDLKDYKFFCFNGVPRLMFIASERATNTKFDFFDLDFNHLPLQQHYSNTKSKRFEKPKSFPKMIKLAEVLSKGIPHVRVDFYDINGKIYFGELTFYHFSGFKKFSPEEADELLGSWIDLSRIPND